MESPAPEIDAEYRQVREGAGKVRLDRAWIEVTGPDAAEYLQSQVTNDIEALEVGQSAYAALLDRKGRIQADMRISRVESEGFLLDAEPATAEALLQHLETYRIGRDVNCALIPRESIAVLGPATRDSIDLPEGGEGSLGPIRVGDIDCLAIRTPWGADLVFDGEVGTELSELLEQLGVGAVSDRAAEILRVEEGRPRLGWEIDNSTMPAEAGIVERAVSFEKGCYIGQEPVARLHYKGKPNRFLRGLRFASEVVPGATLSNDDRELGTVGTVVLSPVEGWIGLAIVRREAGPGDPVQVMTNGGPVEAEVVELPFPAVDRSVPQ